MNKYIVSTTINPPTEAILKYDAMDDWTLVVAGDLKTPSNYTLERGIYLTPEDQRKMDPILSDLIGWNCIQRRMFSILYAYKNGADVIAIIDDDNIPLENWGQDIHIDTPVELDYYMVDGIAFDPVSVTNHNNIWHRGFPLQLLGSRFNHTKTRNNVTPKVQADFWNGDPDIDAICRMEHAPVCDFNSEHFPLAGDKIAPFNSQNTFMSGSILKDYFLFPGIGRMDDIWASFYLQAKGHSVIFGKASVFQQRNEHDLTVDLEAEIPGMLNSLSILQDMTSDGPDAIFKYLPKKSVNAYKQYLTHFE